MFWSLDVLIVGFRCFEILVFFDFRSVGCFLMFWSYVWISAFCDVFDFWISWFLDCVFFGLHVFWILDFLIFVWFLASQPNPCFCNANPNIGFGLWGALRTEPIQNIGFLKNSLFYKNSTKNSYRTLSFTNQDSAVCAPRQLCRSQPRSCNLASKHAEAAAQNLRIGHELSLFVNLQYFGIQNDCFGVELWRVGPEGSRPPKPLIYIDVAKRLA